MRIKRCSSPSFATTLLGGAAAALFASAIVVTQSPGSQGFKSPASKYAISPAFNPSYKAPRTPYGQPDLQGVYNHYTFTSVSRPAEFADREFFTEAEADEITRQASTRPCEAGIFDLQYLHPSPTTSMQEAMEIVKRRSQPPPVRGPHPWEPCNTGLQRATPGADLGRGFQADFYDFGRYGPPLAKSRRTSLVVDPPDGRMPAMTPLALKLNMEAAARDILKRGPEDLRNAMRCIVGDPGGPPSVLRPFLYNDNIEIFQSGDYVAFRHDMNTYLRVVPLKSRTPLPPTVKQWEGDSQGHWEGDTLVVETDNFRRDASNMGALPPGHVTERFTRIDADYVLYEFTENSPEVYAKPYTMHFYLKREHHHVFEYSCHESNYNLVGELEMKRRIEREAAGKSGAK
jgi:hypothetical protein